MHTAFIHPLRDIQLTEVGKLANVSFAVKDLIDVKGFITGGGNPTWAKTHTICTTNAPCVQQLLDAGAVFKGKTITDELAYSLEGRNYFYGNPINPKWQNALSGGSSSGSASAVAQGLVDFALGTDTGGSVRTPAAFCGLWGIRPTHNAISLKGVMPFAPCFDTVGWMSRDSKIFEEVGDVLLPKDTNLIDLASLPFVGIQEAFEYRAQENIQQSEEIMHYCKVLGMHSTITLFNNDVPNWLACYQYLQNYAIKTSLGKWIETFHPQFGENMQANFHRVMMTTAEQLTHFEGFRDKISNFLNTLVTKQILMLPTTPVALLNKDVSHEKLMDFYQKSLAINAVAGLAGLPQITIPLVNTAQYPIAISLIGPKHSDRQLIELGKQLVTKI